MKSSYRRDPADACAAGLGQNGDPADVGNVEQHPKLEDRNMTAVIVPKPQVHAGRPREHDDDDAENEDSRSASADIIIS